MTGAADFGVYVHWPYCARICPYCDFNVYRDRNVDAEGWREAVTAELRHWAARTEGRNVSSVYFGGGTPSRAAPQIIAAIIGACGHLWRLDAEAEITLESNPSDADPRRLAAFAAAGVNRLSLGVQSLRNEALSFLGRDHDAAAGRAAIASALRIFSRVSIDLIYARPGQSVAQWTAELEEALRFGLAHLSLYQLGIEENTAFGRLARRGRLIPAEEDLCADLYEATQEITAAEGVPAYEVSNHAAPGAQSRHNWNYWRQGDYVGVGPGAHGRLTIDGTRRALEAERRPDRWRARVNELGHGAAIDEALTAAEARAERVAMGMRTIEGVRLDAAERALLAPRIDELAAEGFVETRGDYLVATAAGLRLNDAVVARLLV